MCVFLQTECGRTAMQLTTREVTLKRRIVEGGLRLTAIPRAIQASAVARSPPEMEPLSCKLHLKRSTSVQVFAQFTWLFCSLLLRGCVGRCFWGVLMSSGKLILESFVFPNDQAHVGDGFLILFQVFTRRVRQTRFTKGFTLKLLYVQLLD